MMLKRCAEGGCRTSPACSDVNEGLVALAEGQGALVRAAPPTQAPRLVGTGLVPPDKRFSMSTASGRRLSTVGAVTPASHVGYAWRNRGGIGARFLYE